MHCSLRNDKSMSRRKLDCVMFKIDQQLTLDNIKELVVLVVLVPMIFALYDAEPHHRILYLAESLVIPAILARVGESLFVNHLQRFVQDVQARFIGERGIHRKFSSISKDKQSCAIAASGVPHFVGSGQRYPRLQSRTGRKRPQDGYGTGASHLAPLWIAAGQPASPCLHRGQVGFDAKPLAPAVSADGK